jgi:hypothetical protein
VDKKRLKAADLKKIYDAENVEELESEDGQ